MKIVLNIFYWLIIFCVAIISLLLAFSTLKIPGNYKLYVVQSGSMEPAIKTGSIVIVKPKSYYGLGNIVTFLPAGQKNDPTTHRIVEIKDNGPEILFTTKGDANTGEDRERIKQSEILGAIIASFPYLGYVVAFTKTQIGFIFLIVVPATIIIFSEVLHIKEEVLRLIEKRKKKSEISVEENTNEGKN